MTPALPVEARYWNAICHGLPKRDSTRRRSHQYRRGHRHGRRVFATSTVALELVAALTDRFSRSRLIIEGKETPSFKVILDVVALQATPTVRHED